MCMVYIYKYTMDHEITQIAMVPYRATYELTEDGVEEADRESAEHEQGTWVDRNQPLHCTCGVEIEADVESGMPSEENIQRHLEQHAEPIDAVADFLEEEGADNVGISKIDAVYGSPGEYTVEGHATVKEAHSLKQDRMKVRGAFEALDIKDNWRYKQNGALVAFTQISKGKKFEAVVRL